MGVKNNTIYFRMQRECNMRANRLTYYQQSLKKEEQHCAIYQKALVKLKLTNAKPCRYIMNRFDSQFTRGKNDQMIIFYTRKINNLQKL